MVREWPGRHRGCHGSFGPLPLPAPAPLSCVCVRSSRVIRRLCRAFGCRVVGTKADPSTYPPEGACETVHPPEALAQLLPSADFVVLTCPLTEATTGLIG
eukprot:COSAG01_NODE_36113_length_522_cov_0.718676_2_plen_99_part_01